MLDRVLDLQPRQSARGLKAVTYNEPYFDGATQGNLVLPPTLCLEAMFQLTCVLAYASDAIDINSQVFTFAGLDRAKFRHPIVPGDVMITTVSVTQRRLNVWKCEGRCSVGEANCAEAELLVAIQDAEHG